MASIPEFVHRARARWQEPDRPRPAAILEPGPGQESVWSYPRPPRVERVAARVRVEFGGVVIADTTAALRVLETSHPPNYYLPSDDVMLEVLRPADGSSLCEWKGEARYWSIVVGDRVATSAAWSYPDPFDDYAQVAGHLSLYCGAMDACWVGEYRARPQPGGFYGGWITPDVVGPFKGSPGSSGW